MASPEFDLIAKYFARHAKAGESGVVLGVGDDCALLKPSPGCELAISTDTLVSGIHFFPDVDAARLGHKCLAVNLSDLAAMGATPRWFTLALTLPDIQAAWLEAFSRGVLALADASGIRLVGGDTTRGPLSITITVLGEVPSGKALRRDAAKEGDDIWVSGTVGDAALGLRCLQGKLDLPSAQRNAMVERLELPDARLRLGHELLGAAHAAIDISDGLVADLGHICEQSKLGATIRAADVPASGVLSALPDLDLQVACALSGGDDYELCFTAPQSARASIEALGTRLDLRLKRIGEMRAGQGVSVLDAHGQAMALKSSGFDHFSPHG
jgi:thiamine-monophosphate kinase